MNSRQDDLTQGIVSEFTTDTPKCVPLFYSDAEMLRLIEHGPRFIDVYVRPNDTWMNSHIPGAACYSRDRANATVKRGTRIKHAYRIVVKRRLFP
jgi:hypothetical protein